jgi:hypothetical protein
MNKIKHATVEVGLELNLEKTKVMTTRKNQIFKIDGISFRNRGMLHLLRLDCRQRWHVYQRNQKKHHDGKISYVKIGKKTQRQKSNYTNQH